MRKTINSQKNLISVFILISLFFSTNLFSQDPELLEKVRENDLNAVKALIAAGADVNMEDDWAGYYPLGISITKNLPEMAKLLLKSGANINHADNRTGYTPLMQALNDDKPEMAKLLIAEGADIKIKATDGTTALIISASKSREVFDLLLSKGADINAKNDRGVGVFTNCITGTMSGDVTIDFAEYLLTLGADIEEKNTFSSYSGYTPLFWAIMYNDEQIVGFLASKGANVNAKADNGQTPLSVATENGYDSIAKILKENGAK
jgi:ankyrin repeat domain-containing protein 50